MRIYNGNQSTRDILARSEIEIRRAAAARQDQLRKEDRHVREQAEAASPSGSRRSLVDILNSYAVPDVAPTAGFNPILDVRKMQVQSFASQ